MLNSVCLLDFWGGKHSSGSVNALQHFYLTPFILHYIHAGTIFVVIANDKLTEAGL